MSALTAATVTDKQIRDLCAEAVRAGDWRQVDLCDVALGIRPQHTATDRGSIKNSSGRSITRAKARSACAKVISYAQGEAAHGASSTRHHSTKRSPAQLQREIDEALGKKLDPKYPLLTGHGLWHHRATETREQRREEKQQRGHSTVKVDRRKIRYVSLGWTNPPGYRQSFVEGSFPESDVQTLLEGAWQRGVREVDVEGRGFALTSLDAVQ